MKISAKTSNAIESIANQVGEAAFHNYKDGVLAVRVKNQAKHVDGFNVVSCNPNNDGFILKVKI